MIEQSERHSCCVPAWLVAANEAVVAPTAANDTDAIETVARMVLLPGGTFRMGSDLDEGEPGDGEGPSRLVRLNPFWIDPTAVSNAEFARFIAATGYLTAAEHAGWSFVFAGLLPDGFPP